MIYSEPFNSQLSLSLIDQIEKHAAQVDLQSVWPSASLNLLNEVGVCSWGFPVQDSGQDCTSTDWSRFYLDVTAACLTTGFVYSQRQAAVQRLLASDNPLLQERWFPDLISGKVWATVGISHLSTSRQHCDSPAVLATETADGYQFDGDIPWVTGVQQSDLIVTGGQLEDGRQILALIPTVTPGFCWGNTVEMLALNGSATGSCQLKQVRVTEAEIVAGPVKDVMKSGGGGTGSLTTSAIALGVALRAVRGLAREAEKRADLKPEAALLERELRLLIDPLLDETTSLTAQDFRTRANSLVLRAAQAWITATKGSGFVKGHPAERTIRDAMFFLVWSCPAVVAQAALKEFACSPQWI